MAKRKNAINSNGRSRRLLRGSPPGSSSNSIALGRSLVQNSRSISPAQQNCPPWCIQDCVHTCRQDGLSQSFCEKLCLSDCSAYDSGRPVSCGPCVQNVQTCILCGGVTTTRSCDLVVCGNEVCSPGAQCCGPHCCPPTCCPAGTHCCSDGDGCCPNGWSCEIIFGYHFCSPIPWLFNATKDSFPGLGRRPQVRFLYHHLD
jgi:hypothetical protein